MQTEVCQSLCHIQLHCSVVGDIQSIWPECPHFSNDEGGPGDKEVFL